MAVSWLCEDAVDAEEHIQVLKEHTLSCGLLYFTYWNLQFQNLYKVLLKEEAIHKRASTFNFNKVKNK